MMIGFPGVLDDFINPTATDDLDTSTVKHTDQHANLNDAVEALEAKVGVNNSAVATSLDYLVTNVIASLNALTAALGSAAYQPTSAFDTAGLASTLSAAAQAAAIAASQPVDATLTAFAGLTISANSLTIGTGVDSFSQTNFAANTFPARASTGNLVAKTLSDFALTILDDADGPGVRTTIGAGTSSFSGAFSALTGVPTTLSGYGITDAQPLDATLTALAALTIAANSLTIGTGTDAFSQTTFAANTFPARSSSGNLVAKAITDFALTILDDADAGTTRTTIGLGSVENTALSTWAGSTSIVTLGTITSGTWGGTAIGLTKGGTGQVTAYASFDVLTVQSTDIASATTTSLGASLGYYLNVTGTVTINSLGVCNAGTMREVTFTGAGTITHDATALKLPGGANITHAAGDRACFTGLGSSNWECRWYTRANGVPVSGTNTGDQTSIVGITGTIAQFNTACTDADFATGGGTATGTNTGDNAGVTSVATAGLATGGTITGTGTITVTAATSSDQETATSTTTAITPAVQQRHPSAAKGWVKFNGTGTVAVNASYNVSSITDNGTGQYTINWDTDFSSGDYCVVVTGTAVVGVATTFNNIVSMAAGSTSIAFYSNSSNLYDPAIAMVVAFGDQ